MIRTVLIAALFLTACSAPAPKTDPPLNVPKQADTAMRMANKMLPPDGDYIEKYNNGIIKIRGYMAGGMRYGQWASFYPSGQLWSEVMYVRGKRNGKTVSYYESGQLRYQGIYKDDAEWGKWKYWDETGKLAQEVDYSMSRETGN